MPMLPCGNLVKESLFGLKLVDQCIIKTCNNCGITFTAIFKVKKAERFEYEPLEYGEILYKDICVPDKIIEKINKGLK